MTMVEKQATFTFIDLFAGIGGFRIAFQNLGGKCVFSSEIDKYAQQTYEANFNHKPYGDITLEETKANIPTEFDILCGGFPCQAFSIAGKRAGFEDTRGTLFFEVAEILRRHKPKAFLLENVKGLVNHDKGRTLKTILATLREDLGYVVPEPQLLNAKNFSVPQNRERIFIVGFRADLGIQEQDFTYPQPANSETRLKDIIEQSVVPEKYFLSEKYLETLKRHKERHLNKGNGFGYEVLSLDGISNTLVVGGMGRERNLIIDHKTVITTKNKEGVRTLTPREWARLQGFPESFKIVVSDTQSYKQFGNSVAIPAVQAMGDQILQTLAKNVK